MNAIKIRRMCVNVANEMVWEHSLSGDGCSNREMLNIYIIKYQSHVIIHNY